MTDETTPQRTMDALGHGRDDWDYHSDGSFASADGPTAVHLYRLHVIRSTLAFEVKHPGMRMTRVSALRACNEALGTTYRRKQAALDHLERLMREAGELRSDSE